MGAGTPSYQTVVCYLHLVWLVQQTQHKTLTCFAQVSCLETKRAMIHLTQGSLQPLIFIMETNGKLSFDLTVIFLTDLSIQDVIWLMM